MLLSTLMTGKPTSPAYAGFATNDDFVLAIDTTGIAATPSDYSVVQVGITGHEASIAADTADARYVRTGKTQSKTGAQRTFAVAGERYVGDTFQDWALSLANPVPESEATLSVNTFTLISSRAQANPES